MEQSLKKVLFQHNFLVSDQREKSKNVFEIRYALAKLFGIRITVGEALLQEEMISFAAGQLGRNVPEPFYRGFPESVRALSPEQLLFDQIVHYTKTYGFGMFDEQGHSIMEEFIERTAFHEKITPKDFAVLSEEEAVVKLTEYAENLLHSTRPLSEEQFAFLCDFIREFDYEPRRCASKNTAVRLLLTFRDPAYAQFLVMSDVLKLVDELNTREYGNTDLKKLNLKNQDRKFVTAVINELFHADCCDIRTCCEKKAIWNGLLHHIHYQPVNELSAQFVSCIRGKENLSVYSEFERAMAAGDIREAVTALKNGKGSGAVLRRLNYILSRCESEEDIDFVMEQISTSNGIILMQLLMKYSGYRKPTGPRIFSFERHNMTVVHRETGEEVQKRKSFISQETAERLCGRIMENLKRLYAGRLGRVCVDPEMKRIAVPIQMSAASGGWGVLPRGSRLKIERGKKNQSFYLLGKSA